MHGSISMTFAAPPIAARIFAARSSAMPSPVRL
jgi:hypothetical protein